MFAIKLGNPAPPQKISFESFTLCGMIHRLPRRQVSHGASVVVSLYVATMHASPPITHTSSFLSLPEPCSPPSPHISLLCWPPQAPFLLNDHQFCYVDLVMLGKYSTIELYLQHFYVLFFKILKHNLT